MAPSTRAAELPANDAAIAYEWNAAVAETGSLVPADALESCGALAYLLALMHGAMDDAIRAAQADSRAGEGSVPARVAGGAAAHAVVSTLVTERRREFDALFARQMSACPTQPETQRWLELGRRVGASWLDRYGYHGAAAAASLEADGAGTAWMDGGRPLALKRLDQFRARLDLNQTLHDHVQARRAQRAAVAADDCGATEPGLSAARQGRRGHEAPERLWNRAARERLENLGAGLDKTARVLAVLNAAMADACFAARESRRFYAGGSWFTICGNPKQLLGRLVDHLDEVPDVDSATPFQVHAVVSNYPSIPAAVTGAAAEILERVGAAVTIDINTADLLAAGPQLARATAEAGRETNEACDAGYAQGRKVARWIAARRL